MRRMMRLAATLAFLAGLVGGLVAPAAADGVAAKRLFAAKALPADMAPQPIGFYSKGCLAGGVGLPVDGPDWQVMRLSRNRRWGYPQLVRYIEDLSVMAKADGWNGLLVGDMSQPRGGPMLTGHASHQVGLDADIWFTPMPDRRLTFREREDMSAVSMLKPGTLKLDERRWTRVHTQLLHDAASFPEVQRIFVHPAIKQKLCETVHGDRSWLAKIRPYYGHYYHFHVRIRCPRGATGCKPQHAVTQGDGCDKKIFDWWFNVALAPKKPPKHPEKPAKPHIVTLADLPRACARVLDAPHVSEAKAEYPIIHAAAFSAPAIDIPAVDPAAILASKPIEAKKKTAPPFDLPLSDVPVPTPRPAN